MAENICTLNWAAALFGSGSAGLGNYRIIYRIIMEEIEILTIHHGAKLLDIGNLSQIIKRQVAATEKKL